MSILHPSVSRSRNIVRERLYPLVFLLLVSLVAFAGQSFNSSLSITASPRIGFAPLSTNVRMTIEPSPDNRAACFSYDGPEQASQSCWEIDGGSGRTTFKAISGLPAGSYELSITVERRDGTQRWATTTVCSIPAGGFIEESC